MRDFPEIPTARRAYSVPKPLPRPVKWGRLLVILGITALAVGGASLVFFKPAPTPMATQATPDPMPNLPPSEGQGLLAHQQFSEAQPEDLEVIAQNPGKTIYIHRNAATYFREMVQAARRDGVLIVPISGFRTVKYQEQLFNRNVVRRGGVTEARKISAPPGYSEHHTGYALDLGDGKAPRTNLETSFERTAAFKWLQRNAKQFNFELSFDRGNDQQVNYEPWHWRFIGDKASLEVFYRN